MTARRRLPAPESRAGRCGCRDVLFRLWQVQTRRVPLAGGKHQLLLPARKPLRRCTLPMAAGSRWGLDHFPGKLMRSLATELAAMHSGLG